MNQRLFRKQRPIKSCHAAPPRLRKRARKLKSRPPREARGQRPSPLPLVSQATRRFAFVLISFLNGGRDLHCLATPVPIGSRPPASFWPRPDRPERPPKRRRTYWSDSSPGTHSLALSMSRFMENGFPIKPRTPGSFNNSWARSSSAFPEINNRGGTILGGFEFS